MLEFWGKRFESSQEPSLLLYAHADWVAIFHWTESQPSVSFSQVLLPSGGLLDWGKRRSCFLTVTYFLEFLC